MMCRASLASIETVPTAAELCRSLGPTQLPPHDIHCLCPDRPVDSRAGLACLAVLSAETLAVLATFCRAFETDVPYEPGFLGFREVPAYLEVWAMAQVRELRRHKGAIWCKICMRNGLPGLSGRCRRT